MNMASHQTAWAGHLKRIRVKSRRNLASQTVTSTAMSCVSVSSAAVLPRQRCCELGGFSQTNSGLIAERGAHLKCRRVKSRRRLASQMLTSTAMSCVSASSAAACSSACCSSKALHAAKAFMAEQSACW